LSLASCREKESNRVALLSYFHEIWWKGVAWAKVPKYVLSGSELRGGYANDVSHRAFVLQLCFLGIMRKITLSHERPHKPEHQLSTFCLKAEL